MLKIPVTKEKSAVLDENETFYSNLYNTSNPWLHLLLMMVSFDQQSKARINARFLMTHIRKTSSTMTNRQTSLLDFGSGWGSFLMKMPRNFKLYCFDLSSNAMQSIVKSSKYLGYQINAASVEDTEITEPKALDIIVCSHVLEHVENDRQILRTFHSALIDDGLLLINVPINETWDDPKHLRAYDKETMSELLLASDFHILDVLEADKWTGYLLEKEFQSNWLPVFSKIYCRVLRAVLAVFPDSFVRWAEEAFLKNRKDSQLLTISRKTPSK